MDGWLDGWKDRFPFWHCYFSEWRSPEQTSACWKLPAVLRSRTTPSQIREWTVETAVKCSHREQYSSKESWQAAPHSNSERRTPSQCSLCFSYSSRLAMKMGCKIINIDWLISREGCGLGSVSAERCVTGEPSLTCECEQCPFLVLFLKNTTRQKFPRRKESVPSFKLNISIRMILQIKKKRVSVRKMCSGFNWEDFHSTQ